MSQSFRKKTDDKNIYLNLLGKSKSREPAEFLNPILSEAYFEAGETKKGIVLDFSKLEYMNSATVSPIIKIWAKMKTTGIPLTICYDEKVAWQKTSFSAFSIFEKESDLFFLSTGRD